MKRNVWNTLFIFCEMRGNSRRRVETADIALRANTNNHYRAETTKSEPAMTNYLVDLHLARIH